MPWNDEASEDVILTFAKITHPLLQEPLRLVTDAVDYSWQGELWGAAGFYFVPVADDDRIPEARIALPAIDRKLSNALLALTDRARISFWILSSADFDLSTEPRTPIGTPHIFRSYLNMDLVDVRGDAGSASGRLLVRDPTQEPWPPLPATERVAPGLFF